MCSSYLLTSYAFLLLSVVSTSSCVFPQGLQDDSQALSVAGNPTVARAAGQKVHTLLQALRGLSEHDGKSGTRLLEAAMAVANGDIDLARSTNTEHLTLALARAAGRIPRTDLRRLATSLISSNVSTRPPRPPPSFLLLKH